MRSITDDGLHYHRAVPCTPLDPLIDQSEMAQSEKNDFVVALQSGIYGRQSVPLFPSVIQNRSKYWFGNLLDMVWISKNDPSHI